MAPPLPQEKDYKGKKSDLDVVPPVENVQFGARPGHAVSREHARVDPVRQHDEVRRRLDRPQHRRHCGEEDPGGRHLGGVPLDVVEGEEVVPPDAGAGPRDGGVGGRKGGEVVEGSARGGTGPRRDAVEVQWYAHVYEEDLCQQAHRGEPDTGNWGGRPDQIGRPDVPVPSVAKENAAA